MTCRWHAPGTKAQQTAHGIKVFTNSLYFFFCFAVVLSSDLTAKVQYCFDWWLYISAALLPNDRTIFLTCSHPVYNCCSCIRTCTILHVLIVHTYCYSFTRFSICSDCSDKCFNTEMTSVHLQTSFTDGNEAIAIIVYTYTLSLSIQSQLVFEASFVHTHKASIFLGDLVLYLLLTVTYNA